MLKLIGICLTIAGAAGTGGCICMERKRRIAQLFALQRAFFLMAGEISYSRISLPEIFTETGQKLGNFGLGAALIRIGRRLGDGSGRDIGNVWREEMSVFLAGTGLRVQEKELALSFPDAIGFLDGTRQEAAVTEFARQMQKEVEATRLKQKEEDKITMAFCLACGLMAVILLI